MADYNVDLKNPEGTVVLETRLVHPTDATQLQPVVRDEVSPVGTITSGALPTVQLVSGTGAQVSTARDVETHTLWTGNATNNVASATVALSSDNVTYSTLAVYSLAAAVNNTGAIAVDIPVRVPAGWYLKITLVQSAAMPTTTYY